VELRLTEILPDGSETKYRGVTDNQGSFELGALMPGVSYVFHLSNPVRCGFETSPLAFLDRVDTIPGNGDGERATANAVLERNPVCSDLWYVRLTDPCLFLPFGCPDEQASSRLTPLDRLPPPPRPRLRLEVP
jgi:hypothetical protein